MWEKLLLITVAFSRTIDSGGGRTTLFILFFLSFGHFISERATNHEYIKFSKDKLFLKYNKLITVMVLSRLH